MSRMHSPSCISTFFLIMILVVFNPLECEARDAINVSNPLSDSNRETLVSPGKIFELGFFTPRGNQKSNRYVGIWHKLIPTTVVWVANRDKPLLDSYGFFGIAGDGNLKVWCDNGIVVPIATFKNPKTFNRTLRLLDSGNLVLLDGQSDKGLWQSFDYPTDTFLPGMKMDGDNLVLTSWIAPSDPGPGNYTFRLTQQGVYTIQNRSDVYWKSSEPGMPWIYDELPYYVREVLSDFETGADQKDYHLQNISNKRMTFPRRTKAANYNNPRLLMDSSGEIQLYNYSLVDGGRWSLLWSEPHNCSVYDACGKFTVCSMKNEPMCQCLPGYKWGVGEYSDVCDRELECSKDDSRKDGFSNISLVKIGGEGVPFVGAQNEDACKDECSNNCKCTAYLYTQAGFRDREGGNSAAKCWIWTSDLENLRDDNNGGQRLSLRVPFNSTGDFLLPSCNFPTDCEDWPNSECVYKGNGQRRCNCKQGYGWNSSSANCSVAWENQGNKLPMRYVIALSVVLAGIILVSCTGYILYQKRRMAKRAGNRGSAEASSVLFSYESERQVSDLMHENDKCIDVPFFNFNTILSATDNFSDANKLGQGGFGPVYKGKFPGGREIAVKRLSSCSGQGTEEFLNEVVLIAKLQHRNLVRLLGYCIKENEKILLYEYMPNRSLDAFIFDQNNSLLLDWKKRLDIMMGIARGLLYLHQDSRLRIIHRDLKTSNILLDEEMNPKISDFGLARIVQGKGTEASTNKVVGTYGYMSPEYALDGKFSVKSDVFSFGVVMLEITSGKRNTGFYHPQEVMNLLGYTWRLWSENKALDVADPTLVLDSCEKAQVTKCINIGLLCVQEDPNDRPNMSNVVIMLSSETSTTIPSPTQPAFVVRRGHSSMSSSSSTKPDTISYNELTISTSQGR